MDEIRSRHQVKENRFTRNDGIQLIGKPNQNLKSQQRQTFDSKCRIDWFLNQFRNSNVCVLTSKCVKLNKQFRLIGWTYLSVGGQFVCFVSFSGILSPPFRIKAAKCLAGNKRVPYGIWMTRTVVALRRFSTAKRTKLQPLTPVPVSFYPTSHRAVKN